MRTALYSRDFSPKINPLVIIGAGGHSVSVANVALSAGFRIDCFVDEARKGEQLLGYNIIGGLNDLDNIVGRVFAIGVGDNGLRQKIHKDLVTSNPGLRFPPMAHASAVISSFSEIGDGTIVMPGGVIGPNTRIGQFCIINTHSSIDHDSVMLDYSSLAPGAVTGGAVRIGQRSAISIGATIRHGLEVGKDCVVGANSYLNKNLPDNQVAYGVPARQVRERNLGDAYL